MTRRTRSTAHPDIPTLPPQLPSAEVKSAWGRIPPLARRSGGRRCCADVAGPESPSRVRTGMQTRVVSLAQVPPHSESWLSLQLLSFSPCDANTASASLSHKQVLRRRVRKHQLGHEVSYPQFRDSRPVSPVSGRQHPAE